MAHDEYERTIAPAEEVLFRDKVVSRLTFYACVLMGALFLALAAGGAAQGAFAGAIGMALFGAAATFLGLTRSILRTVVTREDVRIHWGLWGPRIALSSIRSVRVRDATRQGMIEASREQGRPRIEVFQIPAPAPIVEIEWTDATGKARRAWIGSSEASSLAAAIEGARGSSGGRVAASGVEAGARIATPDGEEEADTAETSSDEGAKTESRAR